MRHMPEEIGRPGNSAAVADIWTAKRLVVIANCYLLLIHQKCRAQFTGWETPVRSGRTGLANPSV